MRSQLTQYYLCLGVSLAISIGLQLILPFPFGLAITLAVFIILPLIIRYKVTKRMGLGMWGGLDSSRLKFRCSVCQKATSARQCPRCGSFQFKAS